MHPGAHQKITFPIGKYDVEPGMIVQFMYKSSYKRSGKRPTGPRNARRLLWVLDPYYARQKGGGDDVDSRGMYMWGIDLEKVSATQFANLGPKRYGQMQYGPYAGGIVIGKFKDNIPIIDVTGMNGQAKWQMIKGQRILRENYRSYDIDRIQGIKVVRYEFFDPQFKFDYTKTQKSLMARGYKISPSDEVPNGITSTDTQVYMCTAADVEAWNRQQQEENQPPPPNQDPDETMEQSEG